MVWGQSLEETLASMGIASDFEYGRGLDADVAWIHRGMGDTDIYYVANLSDRAQAFEARFRVSGREAEIWHPDTGEIQPASHAASREGTLVPLQLAERESVFVVFRRGVRASPSPGTRPSSASHPVPHAMTSTLAALDGPWHVRFPPGLGAPEAIRLTRLKSWTAHTEPGVKYFSGTATYTTTLPARRKWLRPGARILLHLGRVADLAEVSVNGRPLGTLWKPPYQVEVTGLLEPGPNRLEVKVTNQWTNRLIGDGLEPADRKVLNSSVAPGGIGAGPNPALPEAGLLGPVTLISDPK